MKKYLKVSEISGKEKIIEIENIENYLKENNYKVNEYDGVTYWVCDMNSLISAEYTFTELPK
jgi:hypothetical protein